MPLLDGEGGGTQGERARRKGGKGANKKGASQTLHVHPSALLRSFSFEASMEPLHCGQSGLPCHENCCNTVTTLELQLLTTMARVVMRGHLLATINLRGHAKNGREEKHMRKLQIEELDQQQSVDPCTTLKKRCDVDVTLGLFDHLA